MVIWTLTFIVATLICVWIVFGNGADSEWGMFLANVLGGYCEFSETGVRFTVGIGWLFLLVWYLDAILGLKLLDILIR